MTSDLNKCRVCGFMYDEFYPWGIDGKYSSHEICDCCSVQFGYEDSTKFSVLQYREHWLINMQGEWQSAFVSPPEDWDLEQQLKQIPKEFQGPDDLKIYAQLKAKKSR